MAEIGFPSDTGENTKDPALILLPLMLSTASLNSFNEKWPYRFAISTIVDPLQPTILATFAIGTPAFSIRETAVCLKIVKPAVKGLDLFLDLALSRVRLFFLAVQNLCCAQSRCFPRFLNAPDWLRWVHVVRLYLELVSAGAVPLCGEDVMLWLALREVV